ncbi:MAG: hypothetical protein P4N60_04480 [Verrucomicrobiae bacterium]|nr:hypothetical protein [Verrucomicrobiae bacterium]
MIFANKPAVKLAMAMSPMIGEEETQRQREIRTRLEREEREQARARFRQQLAARARKTFVFLFGAAVVLYLVVNTGRFQDYGSQAGRRISAKVNSHSTLKQNALKYEEEVDTITK